MQFRILLAVLAMTVMTSGCFCATGECGGEAMAEDSYTPPPRGDSAADEAGRAADQSEAIFHKGLEK